MNTNLGPILTPPLTAIPPGMEQADPGAAPNGHGPGHPSQSDNLAGIECVAEPGGARVAPLSAEQWAGELLEAVETGSAQELMDLLAAIIRVEPFPALERRERERMELLQGIALQMRLDLHGMLIHIFQRLEASRTYLDIVRHLAGESLAQPEPAHVDEAQVLKWPTAPMPRRKGPKRDSKLPLGRPTVSP